MTTPPNAAPESPDPSRITPADLPPIRLMEWSVRRELWENRYVYIAPLAVAAVTLFGSAISTLARRHAVLLLDPAHQRAAFEKPFDIAAMMIFFTTFIVGFFYCLEALHAERRDRSILFWKSLPVSDLTTVLSKASIPMLVLPLISFTIVVAMRLIMMLLSTGILVAGGSTAAELSTPAGPAPWPLALFGAVVATALWHAPTYGWLLLVSAWARRAAFLWAVLPFVAINVFEKMAFGTSYFASLLGYRLSGAFSQAFVREGRRLAIRPLSQLAPDEFLSRPGLWIGLVVTAGFIAAAVHLRRNREPI
jgi:ABC-2 type transport system permease protein